MIIWPDQLNDLQQIGTRVPIFHQFLDGFAMEAAGFQHTVLLLNDGTAMACGDNGYGQCDIPPLTAGMSYTQVSAGYLHTVLLRSDGAAVACGRNANGKCDIHLWMRVCHTHRFLQAASIQPFSEAMALLWLAETMNMASATFHPWMKAYRIPMFLQATCIQCFSEVMALLWLADKMHINNATFHL